MRGEVAVLETFSACVKKRLEFCRALPATWPSLKERDVLEVEGAGPIERLRAADLAAWERQLKSFKSFFFHVIQYNIIQYNMI